MSRREKTTRDYKIYNLAEKIKSSGIDRRTFLLQMAVAGVAASLPLTMCSPDKKENLQLERNPDILSEKEWHMLKIVQEHLFPSESTSPGASDFNAAAYVQWVLMDKELDKREQDFLKQGLTNLDNEAQERWNSPFLEMLPENQVKLLKHIESHDWGDSWLSVMLMYIFEALLSDPLYGANEDGNGWKWLNFTAGQPRPETIYSEQLTMIKKR